MALRIAIQMDAIETLPSLDTTLLLASEAQRRGHILHYYTPTSLSWQAGKVVTYGHRLHVNLGHTPHYTLEPRELIDLSHMDAVLVRQDPPFDMAYISATYLLEKLPSHVLVSNPPAILRNYPEKIIPLLFPEAMPPTLISADIAQLKAFRTEYQDIIIKPLYGNASKGVFHITPDNDSFDSVLELCLSTRPQPLIAQRYLPAIKQGEMRVLLIDGQIRGVMRRMPAVNQIRNRVDSGTIYSLDVLTPSQQQIAERVEAFIKEKNIMLAGLDLIGNHLTEVNITSTGGIQFFKPLGGGNMEEWFWDALEKYIA